MSEKQKELIDVSLGPAHAEHDLAPGLPPGVVEKAADTDPVLAMVLATGKVDMLERVLDLRAKEESRQARIAYNEHFSAMQAELPEIQKTKEVRDHGGNLVYRYAPLEDILKGVGPVLAKYMFAYRWSEEELENSVKRVHCIISGHGWEESGYVDIPIQEASKMTNSIQQRGVATTYGKRYSLCNALGIVLDDDVDAILSVTDALEYAAPIEKMRQCKTMEDLKTVWTGIWRGAKDQKAKKALSEAYHECKASLMAMEAGDGNETNT